MIHHEQPQGPHEITVNPSALALMQEDSERRFGKPVSELSFGEASQIAGQLIMASTQGEGGKVTAEDGRTIVDSTDGQEAIAGYGRQMAREMAPRIDDERELVINVTGSQTRWDAILRREPKVVHTFRFRNEPPHYV